MARAGRFFSPGSAGLGSAHDAVVELHDHLHDRIRIIPTGAGSIPPASFDGTPSQQIFLQRSGACDQFIEFRPAAVFEHVGAHFRHNDMRRAEGRLNPRRQARRTRQTPPPPCRACRRNPLCAPNLHRESGSGVACVFPPSQSQSVLFRAVRCLSILFSFIGFVTCQGPCPPCRDRATAVPTSSSAILWPAASCRRRLRRRVPAAVRAADPPHGRARHPCRSPLARHLADGFQRGDALTGDRLQLFAQCLRVVGHQFGPVARAGELDIEALLRGEMFVPRASMAAITLSTVRPGKGCTVDAQAWSRWRGYRMRRSEVLVPGDAQLLLGRR